MHTHTSVGCRRSAHKHVQTQAYSVVHTQAYMGTCSHGHMRTPRHTQNVCFTLCVLVSHSSPSPSLPSHLWRFAASRRLVVFAQLRPCLLFTFPFLTTTPQPPTDPFLGNQAQIDTSTRQKTLSSPPHHPTPLTLTTQPSQPGV